VLVEYLRNMITN